MEILTFFRLPWRCYNIQASSQPLVHCQELQVTDTKTKAGAVTRVILEVTAQHIRFHAVALMTKNEFTTWNLTTYCAVTQKITWVTIAHIYI